MSEQTMNTKIKGLSQPLPDNEIELRVGNIFKYGDQHACIMLAYKTARADARRLDDVVGSMNWQKRYSQDVHGKTVCAIDVWCPTKKSWVCKEDVGEENNQGCKGTYSDAFKRSGFAWGIGRELYELPVLFINLHEDEVKQNGNKYQQSNRLKIQKWTFTRDISASSINVIVRDEKGGVRFQEKTDIDERNSVKKFLSGIKLDKFINDVEITNDVSDLDALIEEIKEDFIISEDIKKIYFMQKERILSGEVINEGKRNTCNGRLLWL
jgi:hypothetical protein